MISISHWGMFRDEEYPENQRFLNNFLRLYLHWSGLFVRMFQYGRSKKYKKFGQNNR